MAYPVYPELFSITLNDSCLQDVWNTNPSQRPLIEVVKPGSYVEGVLRVTVSELLRCNGIFLSARGLLCVFDGFAGSEKVYRLMNESFQKAQESLSSNEHHEERDLMILPKLQLLDCRTQGFLAPGEHQLPFRFEVPASLPSSFKGGHGFITYWIEASIDQRPYGADITCRKDFQIHGLFDLNQSESALAPYEEVCEDSNCCLCCKNGYYSFKITLPKKGFERRETVRPVIEMTNYTPSNVVADIKLTKTIEYEVGGHTWEEATEKLSFASFKLEPGVDDVWRPELQLGDQLLPSRILPSLNTCIKIVYKLRLQAEVSGCNCDEINTSTEILIGDMGMPFVGGPLPVMTQPQTYIYEQVDLTAGAGGGPERRPLLPAGYPQKGGIPQTGYYQGYSGGPGPPIIHQPAAPSAPPGGDVPPPPSYSECIQMSVLSGPGDPSAPPAGHPAGFPQAAASPYSPPSQSYVYHQPEQEKYS
ncbi:arrestin domain-containing protein 3-like [Haliotis rubra]|uniref:arrestin domain-containing protein 3-like n=1 Tax=Haliotis rubra TaxID=36100 RepID=UPI001EE5C184|nr:arrestin domain-containing protein 3-like [Haliotis rubra]